MNAITVPWRPSVVRLSWYWPWTHSQQWTIWNSCCIIWSDGGSYCSAKTLVHIRRCMSPEATTDYTRPFSVTENLSRYQNVQHHVTVCTLTVASRTWTCRQKQSYKFQGYFGLQRTVFMDYRLYGAAIDFSLGPCSCFFAPQVECGWLHFTSVNFASQELQSQIGMAYWWKTSAFLCRYGRRLWRSERRTVRMLHQQVAKWGTNTQ